MLFGLLARSAAPLSAVHPAPAQPTTTLPTMAALRITSADDLQLAVAAGGDPREEVVALVVDDDERGEVDDVDLPHRLHPQLRVLEDVDLLDAVFGEPRGRTADRSE